MDKIVELAAKKYPRFAERRVGFINGYQQAEKDLALTWEDMATIDSLITEVSNSYAVGNYDHDGERKHFYGEVLRRFKNLKNK